ncbi:acyclic terpene utilization AtuA family protein [Actinomycetospora aeridis]|uniref:Acyclic terpene utilization AtuA family protein n=1 Tax=Actinomycetospora aeridis TaxID=3129231 RepID=A0ABU8N829_9PSEU
MIAIANVSGFYGDRLSAAREIVDAHLEGRVHVDVLTGDWLAELTMGLLAKQRERGKGGWATTFVRQMQDVLADCLDAGILVVANAGGLDPAGCAAEIAAIDDRARVAWVGGDDVTDVVVGLPPEQTAHLETGEPIPEKPLVANAYLGCRGIVSALEAGANVVVTGRVTDAAVVVGPAAWRHGWAPDDVDALAGAVVAGHVIECGAQATGGNFSFAGELTGTEHVGLPVAEIEADGSAVITKAAGTGGAVTVETVTAQLLYEVDGPRYLTPDVVARLDTVTLTQDAPDRVRITGTRGEAPPATVKVGAIVPAGWHNEMTFVITGLDVEAKAEHALAALWAGVPGGRDAFDRVATRLLRADRDDPARMTDAVSLLTVAVAGSRDACARLSRAAVETALSGYPGFFATTPPGPGSAASVFWPLLLPAADLPQLVGLADRTWTVPPPSPSSWSEGLPECAGGSEGVPRSTTGIGGLASERGLRAPRSSEQRVRSGSTVPVPLGRLVGARSGDKGGNATLGLWARDDAAHAWLAAWWDDEHVAWLLGEDAAGCGRRLWAFPNLRAVGVTVVGFLGRGVADNLALDPQAKGLGEFVRARHVDIPEELLR